MEKELSTINDLVKNENIEFKQHPTIRGAFQAKIMFENGFGLSIITNGSKRGLLYGNWNQNTYEVGLLKKINKDDYDLVSPKEVESELSIVDPDFEEFKINCGIWTFLDQEKVMEKIKIIKNLKNNIRGGLQSFIFNYRK